MIKKIFSLIAVISLSNIIYSVNLQADDLATFDEWLSNYQGPKNSAIDVGFGSGILSFILMKYQFIIPGF